MKNIRSILALIMIWAVLMLSINAFAVKQSAQESVSLEKKLSSYVTEANSMTAELAMSDLDYLDTTITFAERLSFVEAEDYIEKYEIKVETLELRGLLPNGERVTIWTSIDKGFAETERIVNRLAQDGGYTIAGVIGMYCTAETEQLAAIQQDEATYLVDASGMQTEAVHSKSDPKDLLDDCRSTENNTVSYPKTVAWELEDVRTLS